MEFIYLASNGLYFKLYKSSLLLIVAATALKLCQNWLLNKSDSEGILFGIYQDSRKHIRLIANCRKVNMVTEYRYRAEI
jgi:hypothetical protein